MTFSPTQQQPPSDVPLELYTNDKSEWHTGKDLPCISYLKPLECKAHAPFPIVTAPVLVLLHDQLLGQVEEGVVHVGSELRTCLHYRDIGVGLLELLDVFICYLYVLLVITLVSKDHYLDVTTCILVYLRQPRVYAIEGLLVCEIEDNYDAVRPLVVCIRDRPVSLLSCCVPHLYLDNLTI